MVSDHTSGWHIYNRHGFFQLWPGPVRENPSTPLERTLKISRIAKFESDLSKTNKEIAPQSLKIYTCLYGGGKTCFQPHPS